MGADAGEVGRRHPTRDKLLAVIVFLDAEVAVSVEAGGHAREAEAGHPVEPGVKGMWICVWKRGWQGMGVRN